MELNGQTKRHKRLTEQEKTDLHEQKRDANIHCCEFIWLHAERNIIVNDAMVNKQELDANHPTALG